MPHSVWCLHPALSNVQQADSAFLSDFRLVNGATEAVVIAAAVDYWKGSTPQSRKRVPDLNGYAMTPTSRSESRNREFVLYPNTMTAQQAVDRVLALSGHIE